MWTIRFRPVARGVQGTGEGAHPVLWKSRVGGSGYRRNAERKTGSAQGVFDRIQIELVQLCDELQTNECPFF